MKIRLKTAHLLATWTWTFPPALTHLYSDRDSLCGICRVAFEAPCPLCPFPGDTCPLLIGKCQHAFHMHCLLMWVQQESSRGLCPMCRQRFEWRREENAAAVGSGGMRGVGSGSPERAGAAEGGDQGGGQGQGQRGGGQGGGG